VTGDEEKKAEGRKDQCSYSLSITYMQGIVVMQMDCFVDSWL
jgi:hypothetical protein